MSTLHRIIAGMGPQHDPLWAQVRFATQGVNPDGTVTDKSPTNPAVCTFNGANVGAADSAPLGNGRTLRKATPANSPALLSTASTGDWVFFDSGSKIESLKLTIETLARLHPSAGTGTSGRVYVVAGSTSFSVELALSIYGSHSAGLTGPLYNEPDGMGGSRINYGNGLSQTVASAFNWTLLRAELDGPANQLRLYVYEVLVKSGAIRPFGSGYSWRTDSNSAVLSVSGNLEVFSVRVTEGAFRGAQPELLSLPMPIPQGSVNTLGGAGGGDSAAPGQRVLLPGQGWVVPAGVTAISAVCVGTKLTLDGTTVVSAERPRVGDGGGLGGAGGAGLVTSVQKPYPGAFGGGAPATPEYIVSVYSGGGGGAGGYGGNGGAGEPGGSGSYQPVGVQGAGGGGRRGYAGGGVGLRGRGASGGPTPTVGTPGSANGPVYGAGAGGGGTVGAENAVGGADLAWKNAIAVTPGQSIVCTRVAGGSSGAARIIWGDGRSFPDDAGDV